MQTEFLAVAELTDREVGAWRELAARSLEPNPFFEPELALPVARAIDDGRAMLLVVRDGTDWAAVIPVERARRLRGLPVPVLTTWHHSYSFLGTPLIGAEGAPAAAKALIDAARAHSGSAYVALPQVTGDGPVAELIDGHLAMLGVRPLRVRSERAALRRRPENDYVAAGVKHRREWRRQRRRLGEMLGTDVVTVDRSGDAGAVADFLALEESGWKGRAETAFDSLPGHGAMFTEICAGFEARGRLQLLALEAGSRRLALKCNLLAGEEVFCFKIAFDEELARYSPGIQLELDNIGVFHDQTTAKLEDSCAIPGNSMINRLWPDRRALDWLIFASTPVRGRLAVAAVRAGARLRKSAPAG